MTQLFEGVGIALTSLRAHKMRAALTILGVAIGVTVVMVIGAMISGFNKGISDMLASLGPKTFWVGRYWGGQNDEDPEDPNPWRRRPKTAPVLDGTPRSRAWPSSSVSAVRRPSLISAPSIGVPPSASVTSTATVRPRVTCSMIGSLVAVRFTWLSSAK